MSLYPSLEDMKVDQMATAQQQQFPPPPQAAQQAPQVHAVEAPPPYGAAPPAYGAVAVPAPALYPSLDEYMGTMGITPAMIQENMAVIQKHSGAVVPAQGGAVVPADRYTPAGQGQIAPITGNNVGLVRAEIKQGVREVTICKDLEGKMGLRVKSVNKGVFVAFVHSNSPGALGGLRFGDQILQINGQNVAGWDTDKTMNFLKKASPEKIVFALRDRPFERTITMQKDSAGHVGFVFKENKITAIVKDSSAARNGVLIDHHMVEVNGQNVVGLKEKEIKEVFESLGTTITITVLPSFIYDQIVKNMGNSLIKKFMDHSIPDA